MTGGERTDGCKKNQSAKLEFGIHIDDVAHRFENTAKALLSSCKPVIAINNVSINYFLNTALLNTA